MHVLWTSHHIALTVCYHEEVDPKHSKSFPNFVVGVLKLELHHRGIYLNNHDATEAS